MNKAQKFDPQVSVVGLSQQLAATLLPEQPDPPVPVDGMTFGVATMHENSPHDGEMHPDGDEVLYLISGKVRLVVETTPVQEMTLLPGEGVVVPQGVWHRVDIVEPAQIVYMTPGPNNQFRPLQD